MSFDIVVPVGPFDLSIFPASIQYNQKNVLGYRNIYIVSPNEISLPGCIYVPEELFPFRLQDVESILKQKERAGWYLQQLIKLYAGCVIPGILRHYLVLDADVYFLKPTSFFTKDRVSLFATGEEYHPPYFQHMGSLHPALRKRNGHSGICHHMMLDTDRVKEMISLVERPHRTPFWIVFLKKVFQKGNHVSGASEYEMYFNFMLLFHPKEMRIRPLKWSNVSDLDKISDEDFVAYHHYSRKSP